MKKYAVVSHQTLWADSKNYFYCQLISEDSRTYGLAHRFSEIVCFEHVKAAEQFIASLPFVWTNQSVLQIEVIYVNESMPVNLFTEPYELAK